MKLSNIINQSGNNFGITKIINDGEFNALGLVIADIDISFCTFIEDEKYLIDLSDKVTMIITNREIAESINGKGVCISENPRISFFTLHNYLSNNEEYLLGKTFKTQIGQRSNISDLAYIATENVKIGDNVTVEEFVSIKENTIIGNNTIIRSGSVIGSEGYEFKRIEDLVFPVKHIGWVEIGDNVEIQHNSCIDKAIYPWDRTVIGDYCKIDNLVHIAHGVKLDKGVFIVAGTLMGGRTVVGKNTWIGVGAIVSNGLDIGKEANLNIGSVVTRNVENSTSVSGNFAIEHKKFIKFIKSIR